MSDITECDNIARTVDEELEKILAEIVVQQPAAQPGTRRIVPDANGKILNPATGKLVNIDGRVGRQIIATRQAALVEQGAALPVGAFARRVVQPAVPGVVRRDYTATGRPKPTGAFRLQSYVAPNARAQTVSQFAQQIARTIAKVPNVRQINVLFEGTDGAKTWCVIHGKTQSDIRQQINDLQKGDTHGSDEVGVGLSLSTAGFDVGSVVMPVGGTYKFTGISKGKGRPHEHFKLTEFAGQAKPGDCLFAVLRAVAKAAGTTAPTERNQAIRREFHIPDGDVPADPVIIDKLALKFGLRVRIITGMTVPPDNEREFDDNPARLFDRNLCQTTATEVVVASGGAAGAPQCDIYLADGHYEYISRVLEPISTCRITGDLLSIDTQKARTPAQIAARVVSQGRRWYAEHEAKPVEKRTSYKERIIVYDYETIYTADGTIEPYALGYIVFNPKDKNVSDEHRHEFEGMEGRVTQIIRKAGENRFSVTAPLLQELGETPTDVRCTLVSFNGARFDHFLLAQAANNEGRLTSVFATGAGGLRSLTISGRHVTLDLAKLVPACSLADACEGFRTSPTKLEGFSHQVIQQEYEAGRLYEWLGANRAKLSEYLARDVLSEASLFVRLAQALTPVTECPIYGAGAVQTIGGHAWHLMAKQCPLPKRVAEQKTDEIIRGAVVGGRVQAYTDERIIKEKELHMVDFASLYPTAMSAVPKAAACFDPAEKWGYYPAGATNGEPTRVDTWTEGEVGIYFVHIIEQPPGLPNVLPRREEGKPLDWSFRGEFDTWATHIDLSLIKRSGGSFEVKHGLTWPVARQGIFREFIAPLAKLKDEQDAAKKLDEASRKAGGDGDASYNPALRQVYKLLMNAASGKCCQANYDDKVVLATGTAAQLAAESKMDETKPRTWIPIGAETCIIIGKKKCDKVYGRNAKPSILAVLIYAYSRALVWRTLCQHNCLYSDTDSGLFRTADYEALRAHFPQLNPEGRGKELGDLEQELAPHASAEAFLIGAKDYAIFLYGEDGKANAKKSKLRTKGVNLRRDRLLTTEGKTALDTDALNMSEMTDAYYTDSLELSRPLSDTTAVYEFYERRAKGETVHVFSSQIVRSFKDPDAPLSLTQRYLVKELAGVAAREPMPEPEIDLDSDADFWAEF